jgi:hypothetical protein
MLDLPSTFDDPPDLMSAGARCSRCGAGVERVLTPLRLNEAGEIANHSKPLRALT